MLKRTTAILILSLLSHLSFAQIVIGDLKKLNNIAQYKEGEYALSSHFGRTLRYPTEIRNSEVCTILGVIKVSRNGKIEAIDALNKVPKPFKNQFVAAAKLTDGKWVPSNETSDFFYAIIPIQFSYEGAAYNPDFSTKPTTFDDPIVVKVFSQVNSYKDDSEYLKKVDEAVSKEKYKKALKIMELLSSRDPLNTNYYKKAIELYTKLDLKEEADFYSALIEIIANTN